MEFVSDTSGNAAGTAFYRSTDPIKNLKIRVRLEPVSSVSNIPHPNFHRVTEKGDAQEQVHTTTERLSEEYTFRWQERVLSRFEKVQKVKLGIVSAEDGSSENLQAAGPKTNRIFSYTDRDDFAQIREKMPHLTTSASETLTPLAERMGNLRHRKNVAPKGDFSMLTKANIVTTYQSEDIKRQNHLLSQPVHTMYIMADLSPSETEPGQADEVVLCTIRASPNGVICIQPDFNKSRKPYKIESPGSCRDVYMYTLEDVSRQNTFEEEEKEKKMYRELYTRHSEYLAAMVGQDFEMPPPFSLRVVYMGEILSAKNFEENDLYIQYFVELPPGWIPATRQQLSGVTQVCRTKVEGRDNVAYFAFPFNLDLMYKMQAVRNEEEVLWQWPQLFIEVLSLDSWQRFTNQGYGYVTLPCTVGVSTHTVSCWRPLGRSPISQLRRFFVGGSPELEDQTFAAIPSSFQGSHLSKYGFRTLSTGTVNVRLHTLHQSQTFLKVATSKKKLGNLMDRIGDSSAISSIWNVMTAFMRAKQRMIAARENLKKEYIETLKAYEADDVD